MSKTISKSVHFWRKAVVGLALSLTSCSASMAETGEEVGGFGQYAELALTPVHNVSPAFWSHWGDGNAELSSYRGQVARYGEVREATGVLIYVTEPLNRRTWIKDDRAQGSDRVDVMKLNHTLRFSTGIYPYTVMTSTFAPVDNWGRERFSPVKSTLSVQEWCGHVFQGFWPGPTRALHQLHSYFDGEGDEDRMVAYGEGTLFEDALPIQLRELDGKFAGGKDWAGELVPTLWHHRVKHIPASAVSATIAREFTEIDGQKVVRFTVRYQDVEVVYDIEDKHPRRLLGWEHSDGTKMRLHKTTRLPYWRLNKPGDESYLEELGLNEL